MIVKQFHEFLSSKARPKQKSPSWSASHELDLGQKLEAKLNAAEQKKLSILSNAQKLLTRLGELQLAAKSEVELRAEKERHIGRPAFDEFIKKYISTFKFQSIDTETFLNFLKFNIPGIYKEIDLELWTEGIGIPPDAMEPVCNKFTQQVCVPCTRVQRWAYAKGR